MSHAGILLRVVLVLSLVLSGIGGSFAATTMALASQEKGETRAQVHPAHSGCHDHAAMAHPDPTPAADPGRKLPTGHSDCCGGGLCGCACAQLPSMTAEGLLLVPAKLEHEQFVAASAPSRPSPPLPHLMRPPIG
jgi:hypothetical protein